VTGSYEPGNKLSSSINGEECLDQLNDNQLQGRMLPILRRIAVVPQPLVPNLCYRFYDISNIRHFDCLPPTRLSTHTPSLDSTSRCNMLLLSNREVPGSNLGHKTDYSYMFRGFPQCLNQEIGQYFVTGHDNLHPCFSKSIIHTMIP
jgi:hypothetical protein